MRFMKKNNYYSSLILVFLFGLMTQAQTKKWTLEECIQYALENNISIKQTELDAKTALALHEQFLKPGSYKIRLI